jgi:hypothetical protein
MVSSLTYRTADGTRWGGGNGSDLSATQIDLNFWTLFSAVQALEDHSAVDAGIDYISQPTGSNTFYVHLLNHAVLGPFTIPTSQWNPRGAWTAITVYAPYDTVTYNGSLYLVLIAHTSGATFSPSATDGLSHNLYSLLLMSPSNALPTGGTQGQKLVKSVTGTDFAIEWHDDPIRIAIFVEGQPQAGELLLLYCTVDNMTLPAGLVGSKFYNIVGATANAVYAINKNGNPIGTITFNGSGIAVSFPNDVAFLAGVDLLTFVAPSPADATHANIGFTFYAQLTG